eukprot:5092148-Prymnesium_polylepis.1
MPNRDEVEARLRIGSASPESFDPGTYTECTSASCAAANGSAAATAAKNGGTTLITVGFGGVSLGTLSEIATWPASTYARYRKTAQELYDMITNGEFAVCAIAMDKPQGP